MPPEENKQETVKRTQADYTTMSHSVALNHLQTEIKKSKHKSKTNRITDYLTKRIWAWLYYYITSRFGPNYKYTTYSGADTGIYPLGDEPVSITLTADWATNTPESAAVAESMAKHDPNYTIHLGDTYYVGAPPEIKANFTRPDSPWVRGSKGSFAILGNHEMYARGVAFFKYLLPTLGLKSKNGKYEGQQAGFFCLENEHWRILGLDTGYHSIGKVPILELLPWFAPNCRLDDLLIDWLIEKVKLNDPNDKRGLVILTHHQYISAFRKQGEYTKPAMQLAELIGKERPVLWLWGHEHKLSFYGKAQTNEGIAAYGRCIGHGGMPVELDAKEFEQTDKNYGHNKIVAVDKRTRADAPGLGYNGYVLLELNGKSLNLSYNDTEEKILTERWTADLKTGIIKGVIKDSDVKNLEPLPGKTWQNIVE